MKTKLTKNIVKNELYLYCNGELIYKRWLDKGYGRVFHENEGLTQDILNKQNKNNK